jgi:hypothetical protein
MCLYVALFVSSLVVVPGAAVVDSWLSAMFACPNCWFFVFLLDVFVPLSLVLKQLRQGGTLHKHLYAPNVMMCGSSQRGENSYSIGASTKL